MPSIDLPRLPPGQTLTRKLPVTGERAADRELSLENWELIVEGAVNQPCRLRFQDLLRLPQESIIRDIHCVTSWSRFDLSLTGTRLANLLRDFARPLLSARFVRFEAYSARSHDTSLPLEVALADCWLVHAINGQPLTPEHGFPVRVMTPSRYFYKSLKWLRRIELLEEDRLGFWERTSGYHNSGDPWKEERLTAERFTTKTEADAFRALVDFDAYRQAHAPRVIAKADLSHWQPKSKDLREMQLKACDFRGANLADVDFRRANLTLGKFTGADLSGVDFTGADLEGADFTGSNLNGALMENCLLSASIFVTPLGHGLASHQGLRVVSPIGLLEDQENYLRKIGALLE